MPKITLGPFNGLMPRLSPKLLEQSYAQVATNCYLLSGRLEPSKLPQNSGVALASNTKSIYWFNRDANGGNGYWFQWNSDVNVVRGQIAGDTNLRTYFTGDGIPKFTTAALGQSGLGPYPGASRTLGIPVPSAPNATAPEGEVPEGGQLISTAYVVTYVSDLGEEGPPSTPSNVVDRWDGAVVQVSNLSAPSGSFVINRKRIYRAELNGVFQFVGEVSVGSISFSDDIVSASLAEPVPSTNWDAPNSEMIGLTALPNGILMGWWKNTLAFSEAFQPHAWPIDYRLALDYDIVGAAVSAYGVVVVTKGSPYLIAGTSPDSMSQSKLDVALAGVSKRSVVDMGDYVVYASANGLVAVGGTDARVISETFITPEQWRNLFKPDSIHAYRWDDHYLGFYNTGINAGAFSFHPQEGFRQFTEYAECAFVDDQNGELYIKQGSQLKKWNRGINAPYIWRSKVLTVPPGQIFSVCKVDASSYPVNFQFYADGLTIKSVTVNSRKAFRLPTLKQYQFAEIQVSGSSPIDSIQISTSMSEIL